MMKTKLKRTVLAHSVELALGAGLACGLALSLGGCTTEPMIPAKLDLPPRMPSQLDSALAKAGVANPADSQKIGGTAVVSDNPKPPLVPNKPTPAATVVTTGQSANVTLNFDSLPLPAFIQTVYATVLKRNISIDPAVMARKDLVTLRSGKALTAGEAENSARLLLKSFGIAVQDIGGLIRIVPDSINTGYLPEIRRGRALPDTPLPLRPVFQLVELEAVRNTEIVSYIKTLFGEKIRVTEDPIRNSLLLAGNGDDVQAALEAIQMLDQPLFKGRNSIRITPLIWSAEELVKRLSEILTQEGYAVGTTTPGSVQYPITLLPVAGINSVIVFAQSKEIINHIAEWAQTLDKPAEKSVGRSFFSYQVQNTDASRLADTLQQLLSGSSKSPTATNPTSPINTPSTTTTGAPAVRATGNVVVDAGTNTILFRANGEDYTDMIRLLRELDRPTRQVLIEVTVAEVSLDDTTELGVDWIFKAFNRTGLNVASLGGNTGLTGNGNNSANSSASGGTSTSTTVGGITTTTTTPATASAPQPSGIGSNTVIGQIAGFVVGQLDGSGSPRVVLSALAQLTKTNVLSTPRIQARNGETATIRVGDEVPINTGQQSTSSGTITTTQYRSTGTLLRIKPVVHSSDQVDIDITQENSIVKNNASASGTNPTISTRALDTKLTLRHGETYVMGGLISNTTANTDSGVPFLKDIPILGYAFKKNKVTLFRTELIVLITPYIINDSTEARAVTDAFRKQLGPWAQVQPKLTPEQNTIPIPAN